MASLASIFAKPNSGVSDSDATNRLLSARAGVTNTTMNMIPRSGFAAPLVSGLLGYQTAGQEIDAEGQKKMTDFLSTFQKLSRVSKLMAVKFFNENGPEVGIDAPIDGVESQPDITSAHFKDGHIVGLGMDGIYMPGPDGKWTPATSDFLDQLRQDNLTKKKSSGGSGSTEKRTTVLNSYTNINQKIISATNNMVGQTATQKVQTQAVIDDLVRQKKNMEKLYPWLVDKSAAPTGEVAPAPPAPAPAANNNDTLGSILKRLQPNYTQSPLQADDNGLYK